MNAIKYILLAIALQGHAFAQNVFVVNPPVGGPGPVNVILRDTTGGYVAAGGGGAAPATTVVSTALEASHVLKSSAGSLVSLSWLNTKTTSQYLLIMNSTTVPADGAVTLLYPPIFMPATSNGMITFPVPLVASTGISVSNSSTGTFTKTIGSADCVFTAQVY